MSSGYSPGTWYHLAMTRDGATVRYYLDGRQIGSTAEGTVELNTMYLGTGAGNLDGAIAQFRAYDRALTTAEVRAIYDEGRRFLITDPGVAITRVAPAMVASSVSSSATIYGWGLTGTTAVSIGGVAAAFTNVSASEISVTVPAGAVGFADVSVTASAGSAVATNGIRYTDTPIDSLNNLLDAASLNGVGLAGSGNSLVWASLSNVSSVSLLNFNYISGSGWEGVGSVADPYRLQFDGVNDSVNLGIPAAMPKTVAVWAKADTVHTGGVFYSQLGCCFFNGFRFNSSGLISLNFGSSTAMSSGYSPGTWYHLAMTRDGATVRYYLDGRQIGSTAEGTVELNTMYLGTGAGNLDGAISEFRTYTRDLTAGEIRTIYEETRPRLYQDPAVARIDRVTAAVGSTTAPAPVTLTGWNFAGATAVRFGGVDAASFSVDSRGQITATPQAASADYVTAEVTAPAGTSSISAGYRLTTSAANSLLYFLDALNMNGVNGRGPTQTATVWKSLSDPLTAALRNFDFNSQSGWKGAGTTGDPFVLKFDGSNDYVNLPEVVGKTYATWFRVETLPGSTVYLFAKPYTYTNAAVSSTGVLSCRYNQSSTLSSAGGQVVAGTWYHFAMTFDGANIRCYRNGTQFGTVAYTVTEPYDSPVLGANNAGSSNWLDMELAQFRIYSRGLSGAEITTLHSVDSVRFPP